MNCSALAPGALPCERFSPLTRRRHCSLALFFCNTRRNSWIPNSSARGGGGGVLSERLAFKGGWLSGFTEGAAMRYWLTSTAVAVGIAHLVTTGAVVPATAASPDELAARVDALQKQVETLRKENEALRRRQGSRAQPGGVAQPVSAQPVPARPNPGPYAAA